MLLPGPLGLEDHCYVINICAETPVPLPQLQMLKYKGKLQENVAIPWISHIFPVKAILKRSCSFVIKAIKFLQQILN